jgi:hypothetical protein
MKAFGNYRLWIVAACSCVIAGCQSTTATPTPGSGYQFVRFANPKAAVAASQDATAGPAIASNNAQCRKDAACKK